MQSLFCSSLPQLFSKEVLYEDVDNFLSTEVVSLANRPMKRSCSMKWSCMGINRKLFRCLAVSRLARKRWAMRWRSSTMVVEHWSKMFLVAAANCVVFISYVGIAAYALYKWTHSIHSQPPKYWCHPSKIDDFHNKKMTIRYHNDQRRWRIFQ